METLFEAREARELDREARTAWGLAEPALVEAAGRACARVLLESGLLEARGRRGLPRVTVLAGSGNNAADALVCLRALITEGRADCAAARVLTRDVPSAAEAAGEETPRALALRALGKMGVAVTADAAAALEGADVALDGIAGTGLRGPLAGKYADEWLPLLERLRERGGVAASLDVPSGLYDGWRRGEPLVRADLTLAVEPLKLALYKPAARAAAGVILPVRGIFPPALLAGRGGVEEITWEKTRRFVPPLAGDDYKYSRGVVEIHAGSVGSAGAAVIAARGAQAAGAGLVRLCVDKAIYQPVAAALASEAAGIMVAEEEPPGRGRFKPDAILLGPGWGQGKERLAALEAAGAAEAAGTPLVLDADAIYLARGRVFSGNALFTPHAGEAAAFLGVERDSLLASPLPPLRAAAAKAAAAFLFKSHVLYALSPDGSAGVLDGEAPVLASGGSGDLLAGFCAALAARLAAKGLFRGGRTLYEAASCAASLLVEAARLAEQERRFTDPLDLAALASRLAGDAWLPGALRGCSKTSVLEQAPQRETVSARLHTF